MTHDTDRCEQMTTAAQVGGDFPVPCGGVALRGRCAPFDVAATCHHDADDGVSFNAFWRGDVAKLEDSVIEIAKTTREKGLSWATLCS